MNLRFSFQSDLPHQLVDNLGEVDNFQAWKYLISLKKMNWTPTFPVPEGDEAKGLTLEELGQGQEDHC